ncbi:hypothetical protein D3C72_2187800 [compost metagenome]
MSFHVRFKRLMLLALRSAAVFWVVALTVVVEHLRLFDDGFERLAVRLSVQVAPFAIDRDLIDGRLDPLDAVGALGFGGQFEFGDEIVVDPFAGLL